MRSLLLALLLSAGILTVPAIADSDTPAAGPRLVVLTAPGVAPLGTGAVAARGAITGVPSLDRLCRRHGVTAVAPYYPGTLRHPALAAIAERLRVLHLAPGADARAAAADLAADPHLAAAEIPVPARLFYTPNDPYYTEQWHLPHIGAPAAWDHIRGDAARAAIVAVVDTGLDLDEPDLIPNLWINGPEDLNQNGRLDPEDIDGVDQDGNGFVDDVAGWDFAHDDHQPQDTHSHGTGVAACISAATDNGLRIASIGFGVRLMALQAITESGYLVDGYVPMLYAADNGATVVNCSWGIPVHQEFEQAVVDAVWAAGVVIVAAGGELDELVYPAAYDHVLAVSATDPYDHRASFAPYGEYIDVCAPGVDILMIWDGELSVLSGTSFAAGLVSGLAGLVRAWRPDADPLAVTQLIKQSAVDIDALNPYFAGLLGAGRIDAEAAILLDVTGMSAGTGTAPALACQPNPFNGATSIGFSLAYPGPVELAVFDVQGRLVDRLVQGERAAGSHEVRWDARGLASGTYLVRLKSGERTTTSKLVLVQ